MNLQTALLDHRETIFKYHVWNERAIELKGSLKEIAQEPDDTDLSYALRAIIETPNIGKKFRDLRPKAELKKILETDAKSWKYRRFKDYAAFVDAVKATGQTMEEWVKTNSEFPIINGYKVHKSVKQVQLKPEKIDGHWQKYFKEAQTETYLTDGWYFSKLISTGIEPNNQVYAGTYVSERKASDLDPDTKVIVTPDLTIEEVNAYIQAKLPEVNVSCLDRVIVATYAPVTVLKRHCAPVAGQVSYKYFECYRITLELKGNLWNKEAHIWIAKDDDCLRLVMSSRCQPQAFHLISNNVQAQPMQYELVSWLQEFLGDIETLYPTGYKPIFQGMKEEIKAPRTLKLKSAVITV